VAAPARREHPRDRRAARQQRDATRAPHGQPADDLGDAGGDVGLQPRRGPERHRRRHVEQHPRRERALRDVLAHVRDARAGAGRRVEAAHVVAHLVRADLGELGAGAEPGRAPLARQRPGRAAREHEVERLDERARHRPRPLAARRRREPCDGLRGSLRHAATASVRGSDAAPPTAERIRASTSSGATPSPSAS
jgi:hypothetical protein